MKSARSIARSSLLALSLSSTIGMPVSAAQPADPLAAGFISPPQSAKPRVWWHWMNGNITKEGIKLDLEWMKRTGIGGFQNFDASFGTPQVVPNRLAYMTPEWKDAFHYAVNLADQLGLEVAIAGSPGWSESGGPWVKPSQAMKKFVWSETQVEGGEPFRGKLPMPPTITGPFQNLPQPQFSYRPDPDPVSFYGDSAVIAFRSPDAVSSAEAVRPVITSSSGKIDPRILDDGDVVKYTALPSAPLGQDAWVQFDYGRPQTMRAMTLAVHTPFNPQAQWRPAPEAGARLEASDDGRTFRTVVEVPASRIEQRTLSFPAITARYFRLAFTTIEAPADPLKGHDWDGNVIPHPAEHQIAELVLHTAPRVNDLEEKAAFGFTTDSLASKPTPSDGDALAIDKSSVVDLTSRMRPDGSLDWTPPAGRWTVLRIGYSLTGHKNGPASGEGTGFEVDKLNRTDVASYFNTYLDNYHSAVGSLMGARGLQYMITDSWEAGPSNWTDTFIAEFTRRRGYSPIPWLPVLTGQVVQSAQASDGFLWDFRKTLQDMVADNHYDQLTQILHDRGMAGRYSESHEGGRAIMADGMEVKRSAAVPMGAIWAEHPGPNGGSDDPTPDVLESASVAHLYGQNLVAAESFTAGDHPWGWSPEMIKPTADKAMAMGLNRFVIHTSVHQPLVDKAPGLALGNFGQWFTRNETWADDAKPWISYLTRSAYLLQQGHFSADLLYFYGEDSNITALFGGRRPAIPQGYAYDYLNADALTHLLRVEDGRIAPPSGMRYRLIVLDENARSMSLPVLRRLAELVHDGANVVGQRPSGTPSLDDDQATFRSLVSQLWGTAPGRHSYGKGMVYDDRDTAGALADLKITPDFEYAKPEPDSNLMYLHRVLDGADIYFVSNRRNRPQSIRASFRVTGRVPEIWHADTGRIEAAGYRIEQGRTLVDLPLQASDAVFVVFRKPAKVLAQTVATPATRDLATLSGPWTVNFQPDRGAPAQLSLSSLAAWNDQSDPAVRYFSGTGTYHRSIEVPAGWLRQGHRIVLRLGAVRDIAKVTVNGHEFDPLWKAPFEVDISSALKPGTNMLDIAVTNLWVNRLIGDQQPGAKKITFTTQTVYPADTPLEPSGLLGPVSLVDEARP